MKFPRFIDAISMVRKHPDIRKPPVLLAVLVVGMLVSGCLGSSGAEDESTPEERMGADTEEGHPESPGSLQNREAVYQEAQSGWRYDVLPPVIAMQDSGINPYHEDYRLPEGYDPMQKGYYPEEATLLEISLDSSSYQEAVQADREIWEAVEPGVLYAVNGTRIVGAIGFSDRDCEEGGPFWDCEHILLDHGGHGTLVASAAAGSAAGSCPECRIVMITWGNSSDWMGWMVEQEWVDVFSHSASSLTNSMTMANASQHWTEDGRSWFNAAGNAPRHPVNIVSEKSRPGNFLVGWWDGQQIEPTHSRLYDTLGRSEKDVAVHDHITEYRTGGGTSTAAPDVAGHYAWLLWQTRIALDDTVGFHDGVLARATDPTTSPEQGPLVDGELSARELEDVLRSTARQVAPYPGVPAGGPASYFWEGYGLVDHESRDDALRVVLGQHYEPEREWEDWWHQTFNHARQGYFTYAMCNQYLFPLSPGPNDPTAYRECVEQAEWDPTDGASTPPSPLP